MQRALVVALVCADRHALTSAALERRERLAETALVCQQAIMRLQAHGLDAGHMEKLQHHVLNRTLSRRDRLAA